jgi:hypothetical protein
VLVSLLSARDQPRFLVFVVRRVFSMTFLSAWGCG